MAVGQTLVDIGQLMMLLALWVRVKALERTGTRR